MRDGSLGRRRWRGRIARLCRSARLPSLSAKVDVADYLFVRPSSSVAKKLRGVLQDLIGATKILHLELEYFETSQLVAGETGPNSCVDLVTEHPGSQGLLRHPKQRRDRTKSGQLRRLVRALFNGYPYGSFTQFVLVSGIFWHGVILSEELLSNFPGVDHLPPKCPTRPET